MVAGYLNAPENMVAEVIDGELSLMPRPRPRHARAAGELHGELRGPFDRGRNGPGGWVFLIESELHLGPKPDIVIPDVAGWRRERFPVESLDEEAEGHITAAPDWACEVLSPRTRAYDRGKKMRIYRREAIGHVWHVDPDVYTLEVFRHENGRDAVIDVWEGDVLVRAEPFEAFELALATLWRV